MPEEWATRDQLQLLTRASIKTLKLLMVWGTIIIINREELPQMHNSETSHYSGVSQNIKL